MKHNCQLDPIAANAANAGNRVAPAGASAQGNARGTLESSAPLQRPTRLPIIFNDWQFGLEQAAGGTLE